MSVAKTPLVVDIVSDIVCPWCILGYQQFNLALEDVAERFEVEVRWRPFELNPTMREEGENLREHLARKMGTSTDRSKAAREQLTSLGQSLGFEFDFFDEMRVVNTFRAHQLLHWAAEGDRQNALKLKLFSAHFSQRQDVNSTEVLIDLAGQVGLDKNKAAEVLESARYAEAVREEEQRWLEREIHAVPAFVFNNSYSVLGAQNADTFAKVLRKVENRSTAGAA